MAERVRVELSRPADAWDALEALVDHGLAAEVVARRGGWEIEIAEATLEEASHALDDWLHERGLPFVPLQVEEGRLALCPPAD